MIPALKARRASSSDLFLQRVSPLALLDLDDLDDLDEFHVDLEDFLFDLLFFFVLLFLSIFVSILETWGIVPFVTLLFVLVLLGAASARKVVLAAD